MVKAGREFALQLIRYEQVEGPPVDVNEDEESAEFWEILRTGIFSRTGSDVSTFGDAVQLQKGEEPTDSHAFDGEVLVKRLEGLRPSEAKSEEEEEEEVDGSSSSLNQDEAVEGHNSPRKRLCRLKTYAIYDKDFELFEHAKEGKSEARPSPGLKDSGWRRLKEKIFSGAADVAVSSGNELAAIPSP